MAYDIVFADNSEQVREAVGVMQALALERCGMKAEGYAKDLAPYDTGNLRNDISHTVDGDTVFVGTNVEYAVYQEMGTGKYVAGGRPTPWCYQDAQGLWHWTAGNQAHPFMGPAVADHVKTYLRIMKDEVQTG